MSVGEAATNTIGGISVVPRWVIPTDALEASFREMASDGDLDREGVALWAGVRTDVVGEEVVIQHVVLLRGSGVYRARGFIRIAPELLNEVTDLLASLGDGVYLVGQIHGHPPYCSTDLSPTDVMYGIRTPQYLSVVAPEYGRRGHNLLADCGVHVFEPRAGWRRLVQDEVERRIVMDYETTAAVHTVTADADALRGWWSNG